METTMQAADDRSAELEKQLKALASGANWFYWIAGLSLVNSVIQFAGGEMSFIVGLGITQIFDAFAAVAAVESGGNAIRGVALGLDVAVAGGFVLFGWLAGRRMGWAFLLGMTLYALDGLLFLMVGDWLSIAFHVFALVGLGAGYGALRKLRALEAPRATAAYEPIGV